MSEAISISTQHDDATLTPWPREQEQLSPTFPQKHCIASTAFTALLDSQDLHSQILRKSVPPQHKLSSPHMSVRGGGDYAKLEVLSKLLRHNSHPSFHLEAAAEKDICDDGFEKGHGCLGGYSPDRFGGQDCKPSLLPRDSPYVGSQRHAPPSPLLSFVLPPVSPKDSSVSLVHTVVAEEDPGESLHEHDAWCLRLPEDIWERIFSSIVGVPSLHDLLYVARGFPEILRAPGVWRGRCVRISPNMLKGLAPRLSPWLESWRFVSKLVLPNSSQMIAEVSRLNPNIPLEVAWRFSENFKGNGVQVLRQGRTVRRIGKQALVVVGDAPISRGPSGASGEDIRAPYFEVRLDKLDTQPTVNPNDFGIGVTAMNPALIKHDGFEVAGEVPRSWIVDFTRSMVVLTANNDEAAVGHNLSASDVFEGDRIGLRVQEDAVEVFVNGLLRQRLVPEPQDRPPLQRQLYPVLDLYGRTTQISRVDIDMPLPILDDDLDSKKTKNVKVQKEKKR
eukprot:TRINITY_DN12349_c0_g1_i1.p1 TRINITY_DN12349_c0_g1~~TRINITY_DN12349_c0_g1_i1.p1  ORF type:complete len:504 (+),score=89.29 TRINITY_DN12349_c0_g1_i1:80-1591(+)